MRLLLQRGRLLVPHYKPDANELIAMVRIARLVEGMPLALVLAASWLEVMSFGEIADEIMTDLDFLRSECAIFLNASKVFERRSTPHGALWMRTARQFL